MAERLAEVSAQIQNVRQLEAVVTALRGIAASRSQRARSLLAGIDAYSAVVSRAIGQALTLMPADFQSKPDKRRDQIGLILFCAEQGFAGAFSERVRWQAMWTPFLRLQTTSPMRCTRRSPAEGRRQLE
jgi:F-type H+-transporting ATPase subunit gamma